MKLFAYGGFTLLNLSDPPKDTQKSIINHAEFAGWLADDKSQYDPNIPLRVEADSNAKQMCAKKCGLEMIWVPGEDWSCSICGYVNKIREPL